MKRISAVILLLFTVCALCSGCVRLSDPETNLEFWIAERVAEDDFSEHQQKYGLFGGCEYYGLDYEPIIDDQGQQTDPEHCVIYTVTSYPDYASRAQHVTRIYITDPKIEFYGISLNSTEEEKIAAMNKRGFDIECGTNGFIAEKGKYRFIFSPESISINVEVTNVTGIVF